MKSKLNFLKCFALVCAYFGSFLLNDAIYANVDFLHQDISNEVLRDPGPFCDCKSYEGPLSYGSWHLLIKDIESFTDLGHSVPFPHSTASKGISMAFDENGGSIFTFENAGVYVITFYVIGDEDPENPKCELTTTGMVPAGIVPMGSLFSVSAGATATLTSSKSQFSILIDTLFGNDKGFASLPGEEENNAAVINFVQIAE